VATPFSASGIKDNYNRGILADFLWSHIKDGSPLSVVSAFFRVYTYDALKGYLDRIGHIDFLFGEPRFVRSLDPDKTEKKSLIIDMSGLKLADCPKQKRAVQECQDRILKKVSIESVKQTNFLHGKMYHISCFSRMTFTPTKLTCLSTSRRPGFRHWRTYQRNNGFLVLRKSMLRSPTTTTPSAAASNP